MQCWRNSNFKFFCRFKVIPGNLVRKVIIFGVYVRLWSTHTDSPQRERDRKIAVTLRKVNISHMFYTEMQKATHTNGKMKSVSAFTVIRRRYHPQKKTLSSTRCQHTQDENATLPVREREIAVACAQLLLDCHNVPSSSNTILKWDRSLLIS